MNPELASLLFSAALALIAAYVGWVHHRQSKLEDRLRELETKIATFGDVRQSLRDMDMKLDNLTRVVYLIAGKEGVSA